jgi:hypothetical protein
MLEISKKNSLKLWREFLEIFQKVPLTILLGTLRKKKKKEAKWRVFATKKITASLYGIVHNLVLERRERERERERELCVCFCVLQMEEVHQKLELLQYPRASAPSQSLLYAGLERYELLQWLFFRWVVYILDSCYYDSFCFCDAAL